MSRRPVRRSWTSSAAPDPGIQLLLHRAAIGDVILRYAQAVDRRKFDQLRACFTADAVATYSGVTLEPGVDVIINHVSRVANARATTHFMGPSLIELDPDDPDGADVLTPAIVYIDDVDNGVETVRTRGLSYADRFVRQNGKWLIHRRIHSVDWMYESPGRSPNMAPLLPPDQRPSGAQ